MPNGPPPSAPAPHLAGPPLVLAAPAPSLLGPLLLAALGVGAAVLLAPRLARALAPEGAAAFGPAGQPTIPFRPQGSPVPGLGEQLERVLVGTGIRQVATTLQGTVQAIPKFLADLFRGSPAEAVPVAEVLREAPAAVQQVESLVEAGSSAASAVEAVETVTGLAGAAAGAVELGVGLAGAGGLAPFAIEAAGILGGVAPGAPALAAPAFAAAPISEAAAAGAAAAGAEAAGVGALSTLALPLAFVLAPILAGVFDIFGSKAGRERRAREVASAIPGLLARIETALTPDLATSLDQAATLDDFIRTAEPVLGPAQEVVGRFPAALRFNAKADLDVLLPPAVWEPLLEKAQALAARRQRALVERALLLLPSSIPTRVQNQGGGIVGWNFSHDTWGMARDVGHPIAALTLYAVFVRFPGVAEGTLQNLGSQRAIAVESGR